MKRPRSTRRHRTHRSPGRLDAPHRLGVDSRRGGGKTVATRAQITLEDIQEAYEEARAVEVEEAGPAELSPPEEGEPDDDTPLPTDVERSDTEDAEAEKAGAEG